MNAVARAAADAVLSSHDPTLLNIVHPHPVQARELFDDINHELGLNPELQFVPLQTWVEELERAAEDASADRLETVVSCTVP